MTSFNVYMLLLFIAKYSVSTKLYHFIFLHLFIFCLHLFTYLFIFDCNGKKLLKSVKRNEKSYCRNKSGTAGFDTPYTVGEITWYD